MKTWQPIETAPKDETWVLLWFPQSESKVVCGFWSEEYADWFDWEGASNSLTILTGPPTHWMPIPNPPQVLVEPTEEEQAMNGPMEITEEMLAAGRKLMPFSYSDNTLDDIMRRVYHAMRAAAPRISQMASVVEEVLHRHFAAGEDFDRTSARYDPRGFELPTAEAEIAAARAGDYTGDVDDYMAEMIVKNRMNQTWDEAIEAAAKVADGFESAEKDADIIADRIRALKKKDTKAMTPEGWQMWVR